MLFALNQGEVCTCQSRLLIQEDIYDQFMEKVVARTEAIVLGDPLDPATMMGAQVSLAQHDRIVEYINIGVAEGAKVLTGGSANDALSGGHYIKPTILGGTNDMRVFQEEIFGPVTSATTFKTVEDAVEIANDTECGRCVDPRHAPSLPGASRHRGWPGLGELLPRLPRGRALRRLQEVGLRARDPQDDAQQLPSNQEHDHLLRPQQAGDAQQLFLPLPFAAFPLFGLRGFLCRPCR